MFNIWHSFTFTFFHYRVNLNSNTGIGHVLTPIHEAALASGYCMDKHNLTYTHSQNDKMTTCSTIKFNVL